MVSMNEDEKVEHWWLVRHAPVQLKFIYGQMNVEADFSNLEAFDRLAKVLPEKKSILSSDLDRCVKTAQMICKEQEKNEECVETCSALREQHFGDWQGLTFDEAKEVDQSAYQLFWENPAVNAPPSGESFDDVRKRVVKARKEISSRNTEENILVVAHAGTIRAMLAEALGMPSEKALLFNVDPLSLTKLTLFREEQCDSWQINWINRTY